jgi:DNA-binding transcriptional LysR family regulator
MPPRDAPDWNDLQLLMAVLRAGSLTRAASETGVSQPTIGRRMKVLEACFGAPLFYRGPSGLEPTPLTLRIVDRLAPVKDAFASIVRIAEQEAERPKTFRLTTTTTIAMVLSENLKTLCPSSAGACLDILPTRQRADLSHMESDMAIRLRRPPETGPLTARKLGVLAFAVYGPRRLISSARASTGLRCIGLSSNRPPPQKDWFDSFAESRGGIIVARLGEVYLRLAAVRQGFGVSLLPCVLGDREADLMRLTPPVRELTEDMYLLVHTDIRKLAPVHEITSNLVRFFKQNDRAFSGADRH